jgi:NAD(P)-dependent dehydrogenase (short-subunit alcohol dehydrogenase family)
MNAYGKSMLANVLFASELNHRGTAVEISSLAVDPGTANTGIQPHSSALVQQVAGKFIGGISYSLDRVADPVIFAA